MFQTKLLTRQQVRDVDRIAIEEFQMPGIMLMENAGAGATLHMLNVGVAGEVLILAGKGNNGGDGFVIARHLQIAGMTVRVLLTVPDSEISGDAKTNLQILRRTSIPIISLADSDLPALLKNADWVVDALLGTGTQGAIRNPIAEVIEQANGSEKPIFAIDVPSGMDCDTGEPLGPCIRAKHTATFVANKIGFANPASLQYTGDVQVVGIGVPLELLQRFTD